MFYLAKVLRSAILPPGSIVLMLVAVAVLLRRRPKAALMVALVSALTYLASIQPTSGLLLGSLEKGSTPIAGTATITNAATIANGSSGAIAGGAQPDESHTTQQPGPSLIVVLGGGADRMKYSIEAGSSSLGAVERESLASEGGGVATIHRRQLSNVSTTRTAEGAALYHETGLPIVLAGGSPLAQRSESEASAAARYLARLGVPAEQIVMESRSRNTWENAAFVAEITPVRSIFLVTSAYHMPRAIECFVAAGFSVTPWPADHRVTDDGWSLWDFVPSSGSLDDTAAALHEHIGRLFYRIRYGVAGYRFRKPGNVG